MPDDVRDAVERLRVSILSQGPGPFGVSARVEGSFFRVAAIRINGRFSLAMYCPDGDLAEQLKGELERRVMPLL